MKPSLRKVTIGPLHSFSVRKDQGAGLVNNWHYHPEVELLFIKGSKGSLVIGDHIGNFQSETLLLLGSGLPHTFVHDPDHVLESSGAEAIVVHFMEDFWGDAFLSLPEMHGIKRLLHLSRRGLRLEGIALKRTALALVQLLKAKDAMEKMLLLLRILHGISVTKQYTVLSSEGFSPLFSSEDDWRISRIYHYTFEHFREQVSMPEVAALVNLTKESFCRYFKQKTRKTYWQFLMEIRIGSACRLLQEGELNVSEIAYQCGYNNLSNFNHQFKRITLQSPSDYQRKHAGGL